MEFIRRFNRRLNLDRRGVALFMVIASVAVLVILASEFVYMAQVNQRVAYDAADKVRAHYLAKSALKLSLLRLKAYQHVKDMVGGGAGGGGLAAAIPKGLIDSIWSFPLAFPIPTTLPGMSQAQKDALKKFEDKSSLAGNFTALIESESSKYNINTILAPLGPKAPVQPGTGGKPATPAAPKNPDDPDQNPDDKDKNKTPTVFDADKARKALLDFLQQLFQNKADKDEAFSDLYRDLNLEELVDAIAGWADRTYERKFQGGGSDTIPLKRAPFYSLTELHMVPRMDDGLYNLFAPSLTVSPTPGINVNTMTKETLRALIPGLNDQEVKEFFEYRDSQKEDNLFKKVDDFLKYAQNNFSVFRGSAGEVQDFKDKLAERNVRLVTDETEFRISVTAYVNNVSKQLEAMVTLTAGQQQQQTGGPGQPPGQQGGQQQPGGSGVVQVAPLQPGFPEGESRPDSGLKITFMRIY